MHVREIEVIRKKKKKAQKKPLRHDRDLNPRNLSPEPSMLSIRPCPRLAELQVTNKFHEIRGPKLANGRF